MTRYLTLTMALAITAISAIAFAADKEIDTGSLTTAYNICRQHARQVDGRMMFDNGFGRCGEVINYYSSHAEQRARSLTGWQRGYVDGVANQLK